MPMIALIIAARGALRAAGSHLGMRRVQKTLHIGVHRTATTTFQDYLNRNQSCLADGGIAVWTPRYLRGGLFSGMIRPPHDTSLACERSAAMVGLTLARLERKGFKQLVVSEENMIGTIRVNLRDGCLYSEAAPRLARFAAAFGHKCDRIVMGIRSYDTFWTSSLSYAKRAGIPDPTLKEKLAFATHPRGWRDLIADVKAQFPETPLVVTLFEDFASYSNDLLNVATHGESADLTLINKPVRRNMSPENCGLAFDDGTCASLQARYAGDIAWLENGADGLATLVRPQINNIDDTRVFKLAKAQHGAPDGGHHGKQQRLV